MVGLQVCSFKPLLQCVVELQPPKVSKKHVRGDLCGFFSGKFRSSASDRLEFHRLYSTGRGMTVMQFQPSTTMRCGVIASESLKKHVRGQHPLKVTRLSFHCIRGEDRNQCCMQGMFYMTTDSANRQKNHFSQEMRRQ